ncbi:sulfite dehydrogenase [Methylobacterium sp. SD274]|uniref:sulfite dehydrogenase n=1 Tax=Methylobacterium sp. SD274 TaxID=2782009 RepID=UPI001FEF1EAB|nr:sulfite dehydrogenase [Methylobacterium sp. SD274]
MSFDIMRVPRRSSSRRGFLRLAGGAAGGIGIASAAQALDAGDPLAVPEWSRTPGAPSASPPYGRPSPYEVLGRKSRTPPTFPGAASTGTPLQHLHGIITPNGLHFERHHAGVPAIDPERHRLAIHGLVERPLVLTMDDLVRMPSVSRIHFLECSGNTPWLGAKPGWTLQESHGLLSCAEWTGVDLATLLDEVGVKPGAAWILAEGADAAGMTRSIPLDLARDGAILAYAQNGERLRPEQGYPLRLFVPGVEGNLSIKWLRRLKVGDQPFQTREETSKYTDLMPDGSARQFTFAMEAKSVITSPSGGEQLRSPGFREIRGLAWTGRGRIAGVEVSTDGGACWQAAVLEGPILPRCLTRFRLPWRWEGGPAHLLSRATDETGYVQPPREALLSVRGTQSFYHNNAIAGWRVAAGGNVSHAV